MERYYQGNTGGNLTQPEKVKRSFWGNLSSNFNLRREKGESQGKEGPRQMEGLLQPFQSWEDLRSIASVQGNLEVLFI